MRRLALVALLVLPQPVLAAGRTLNHCNYYHYELRLPRPVMGLESKPVELNETAKMLHAVQAVCMRMVKANNGKWLTVAGSRRETWKLNVTERQTDVPSLPPEATITIRAKRRTTL